MPHRNRKTLDFCTRDTITGYKLTPLGCHHIAWPANARKNKHTHAHARTHAHTHALTHTDALTPTPATVQVHALQDHALT